MSTDRKGTVAGEAKAKLEEPLDELEAKIAGAVDRTAENVQAAYGRAKDAASGYAEQARDLAGGTIEKGRRYVEDGLERYPAEAERYYRESRRAVSRQVEQSPLAALLLAGAVGYALALLVHGRRSVEEVAEPEPEPRPRRTRAARSGGRGTREKE